MSEEIDRLKKEYEEKCNELEKSLKEQRARRDNDFKLQELESAKSYRGAVEAMNLKYAEALNKPSPPNKNRLITFAEAEQLIAEAEQRIYDAIRKSYGG